MTPDYSTLDTAALVAAAEEALKGVAASAWGRDEEDDAAFIVDAPALVKAELARLRECKDVPPAPLFKVGDLVTVKFGEIGSPEDWVDGQSLKVTAQEHDPLEEQWWYTVTDGIASRKVAESGLEPVTNG